MNNTRSSSAHAASEVEEVILRAELCASMS